MTATLAQSGSALIVKDGKPTWRYRLEPFQQAFLTSGLPAHEIELRSGFCDGYLPRVLGLKAYRSGTPSRPRWCRAETLSYENACRIARALHMDLIELGL